MGSMATTVIVTTLSRYLFKFPIFWGEELSRYLMVWICFIGAAVAIRENSHVSIEYLVTRLPKIPRRGTIMATKLIVMIFLFYLAREGFKMAPRVWRQLSPAMRISMTWAYLAIPIGSALMLLEVIFALIDELKSYMRRN